MALSNPCMKFKTFFDQKTLFEALWKCHLQKIFITFSRVRQIQDLGQSKYKLTFLERTHGISKILFIYGSSESLASLENKIRMCPFLGVHSCKKTVCIRSSYLKWPQPSLFPFSMVQYQNSRFSHHFPFLMTYGFWVYFL